MDVLKRALPAILGIAFLAGCGRDFSSQWLPTTSSDSGSVAVSKPQSPARKDQQDSSAAPGKAKPTAIPIASLSAPDLRLNVGDTKPADVTVLPADATSPLYEMTSSKPDVATVTANGIHGTGEGSATITVHSLDGSNKTAHFHVIVDAIFQICILPCVCLGKAAGKGDGKGKSQAKGKDGGEGNSEDPADPCQG